MARRNTPLGTRCRAIDTRGPVLPPIVVHGVRCKCDATGGKAKREHEVACARRGNDHLIGKAKKQRPDYPLETALPHPAIQRSKRRRIRTEQKRRPKPASSEVGDPERGVAIAGEAQNGVEISTANESPNPWIEETEERLCTGTPVWDVRPGIAIEEWHIPLNLGAKFRIVAGFRTAKRAIGHVKIKRGVLGHAAKNGRHVLNGMRCDGKDSITAFRHSRHPVSDSTRGNMRTSMECKRDAPRSSITVSRGVRLC